MMQELLIGTRADGTPFTLPADLGDKKIAVLAQSKKGKTYGLGDVLEELAKAQRPFIATDPANNLWGLRVLPDGRPSGLKVVVIGGDHADIPFEKDAGERMAEALLATPICAVLDFAFQSLGSVRRFMTDFSGTLMRHKPEIPRVVVLEECPTLIPQNAFGVQAQVCKSEVKNLAVIGGNFGYGVIAACQRAATMDKDVLSQCEALIVLGITHKKDRTTVREWMEAKDIDERVAAAFEELGSLKPGEAWLWWPGEDRFEKFTFRKRETLHPREMRKLGLNEGLIQLGDMEAFVNRLKREITRTQGVVPAKSQPAREKAPRPKGRDGDVPDPQPGPGPVSQKPYGQLQEEHSKIARQLHEAMDEIQAEKGRRILAERKLADAERRLAAVREHLKPEYDNLRALFEDLGPARPGAAAGVLADDSKLRLWMDKAPSEGIRKMLEYLRDHGAATMPQLCQIAGVAPRTGRNYVGWIKRMQIVEKDGNTFKLRIA